MQIIFQYQFFILLFLMGAGFGIIAWHITKMNEKFKRFLGGSAKDDFQANAIERLMKSESKLEEFEPRLMAVETSAQVSIQKVGFARFNPFQDTGGDNSFSLALLDKENNGVLISSFYAREGAHVYAKNIVGGRTRYPLSGEEKKVLEETISGKSK